MKRNLLFVIGYFLFAICFLPRSASAQEWVEFRRIVLVAGEPSSITLDDTSTLTTGDTSLIVSWRANTLVLLARDTASRRLRFNRQSLGPIELVVSVRTNPNHAGERDHPDFSRAPEAPPPTAASSMVRPPAEMHHPAAPPPPIVAPPPPLVLSSPPFAPATVTRSPANEPMSVPPESVEPTRRPSSTENVTSATAVVTIPSSVIERAVPRGSTRRIDTSAFETSLAKPDELALFTLATDLFARGLFGDAISQFRKLLADFPKSSLRDISMIDIGQAYKKRAQAEEEESLRQRDLRRSGGANKALDDAIRDFGSAINSFREAIQNSPKAASTTATQLAIAQSLHGLVRAQFEKGGVPQDSPAVVVEYLRAFIGATDTGVSPDARLGIAQYYRDLGDARLLAKNDRPEIRQSYDRAVEEYASLINMAPSSFAAEEALIDLARLFDRNLEMRRFNEAVRNYEQLLAQFPTSRYADEARNRVRWIRENYL